MHRNKRLFFCCGLLLFLGITGAAQVNLLGKPGYMATPSAAWEEKPLGLSFAYLPKEYSNNVFVSRNSSPGGDDIYFYNARLGFTSFMEVNINIAYRPSVSEVAGIGDRHLDFRFLLLSETSKRPSVVLGITPPGSIAPLVSHDYLVATKNFSSGFGEISLSLGYGSPYLFLKNPHNKNVWDLLRIERKDEFPYASKYLDGFFGGIFYEPIDFVGLMLEYDTHTFNAGAYLKPFDWLLLQGYSMEGKEWAFTFAFHFPLNFSPRALRRYEKNLD